MLQKTIEKLQKYAQNGVKYNKKSFFLKFFLKKLVYIKYFLYLCRLNFVKVRIRVENYF